MSILNKNPGMYQDDMIPIYGRKKIRSVQADVNKKNVELARDHPDIYELK